MENNEQENKNLIEGEIKRSATDNLFGISDIPSHSHTGVDSAQISLANLTDYNIQRVSNANTAPTATLIDKTIQLSYDVAGRYVLWARINKTWLAVAMSGTFDGIYEIVSNKSSTTTLGTSDALYPTQKAVKTYVDNNINIKSGTFYKLSDSTTQNVIAHGLGRTPRFLKLTMISSSGGKVVSVGTSDGTTHKSIYVLSDSTVSGIDSSFAIHYESSGVVGTNKATVTLDATNITLDWTKTGTPVSADTQNLWEAY